MELFQRRLSGIFLIIALAPSNCASFQAKCNLLLHTCCQKKCRMPPLEVALLPPEVNVFQNMLQSTFSEKTIDEVNSMASKKLAMIFDAFEQNFHQAQLKLALYSTDNKLVESLHLENLGLFVSDFKANLGLVNEFWISQLGIDKLLTIIPTRLGPVADAVLLCLFTAAIYGATGGSIDAPTSPYPMGKYDPYTSKLYFQNRLLESFDRALKIALLSANFLINIALDAASSNLQKNADLRASQLTELLTTLGPSFIKIGQSLSIRTDILSPAYARGLKTLQDQVPPFDTWEARKMIQEELGLPLESIFSEFSATPVAAASLGQVYKAKLRSTGEDVAVKVQRPDVLHQIALDMHLIREAAPFLKRTFQLNTDLVDVVDKWGVGFVDELDYQQEGRNSVEFMESIRKTPLADVVIAPEFMEKFSSGKILVTKWVDGERLDKCTKSDVTALCSIAMNTYLTMMLETGVLHADPHPGNLLRTPDGKLCILDWGMVTRLDPYLQTTLVEHIAHLVSADYAEVPKDLLLLGFIEESKASAIEDSGIVEVLAEIYGAWTKGGGATAINVPKVVSQLQDLQEKKGNLFRIPSYFAYIAKSFSVLEGIGLSNDSSYSIVKECLPYVSKRLLTDDKLSGSALNIFLFGPEKNSRDRLIDFKRVEDLVEGFAEYSVTASGASLSSKVSRAEQIEKQSDLILDLLLIENEETPLQKIFFEQLAKIISSSSRSLWSTLRERSGTLPSGRTVLGTMVDPLGIWRTSPLVRVNELDVKTIETTRNLIGLFQKQSQRVSAIDASSLSNEEVIAISSSLVRKLWGRRFSLLKTGGRLSRQLLQMTADRLERGERDVLFLRPLNEVQSIQTDTVDETNTPTSSTSRRLLEAERLLGEAEALEMAGETVSAKLG